jgi:hypothetical protein
VIAAEVKVAAAEYVHPDQHCICKALAKRVNEQSELEYVRIADSGGLIIEAPTVEADTNPVFGDKHVTVCSEHAALPAARNIQ